MPPVANQKAPSSLRSPVGLVAMETPRGLNLALDPRTLSVIYYGATDQSTAKEDVHPIARIPMRPLEDSPSQECWIGLDEPVYGESNGIRYAATNDLLMGVGRWPTSSIQSATKSAYHSLLSTLKTLKYEHLLRVWQFFPDINHEDEGLERYQSFCLGRHEMLQSFGFDMQQNLPAASALGSSEGDFWLIFIAGNGSMASLENPNQVSAFHYPPIYGPKSPSFSRAVRFKSRQHDLVFISGTASIVGHQTHAPEDVIRQCEITVKNLSALLKAHQLPLPESLGDRASYKIYLRRADDQPVVKTCLDQWLHPLSPRIWLEADICRRDLLLEIEATLDLSGG